MYPTPATYGSGEYGIGRYDFAQEQGRETHFVNQALTPLKPPIFTGLKLYGDIKLGNLTLNTLDEYNVVWVCTNIEGWWTHPSPEVPDFKRGWGDGSFDVKGRYNARELTLEGVILTPDPSLVPAARQRLVEATNLVYSGAWLKTTEENGTIKSSYVRLSGEPNITTVNARGRTEFSIGLRAADPIKYEWNNADAEGYFSQNIACKSVSPAVAGTASIINDGNYNVGVYLTVTGPLVGPSYIDNTTNNQTITITGALRNATTKTINNRGLTDNLVTIGTTTAHGLVAGDVVTISGLGSPYDGQQVVLSVVGTPATSTQFTYEAVGSNVTYGSASGTLTYGPDVLEIDTYNRQVYLNGEYAGARAKLDVYNEWIVLSPGANTIAFRDNGVASGSTATLNVLYKSGWLS